MINALMFWFAKFLVEVGLVIAFLILWWAFLTWDTNRRFKK